MIKDVYLLKISGSGQSFCLTLAKFIKTDSVSTREMLTLSTETVEISWKQNPDINNVILSNFNCLVANKPAFSKLFIVNQMLAKFSPTQTSCANATALKYFQPHECEKILTTRLRTSFNHVFTHFFSYMLK